MAKGNVADRIEFLAKKFDVFECGEKNKLADEKKNELKTLGYEVEFLINGRGILAIIATRKNSNKERTLKQFCVSFDVFSAMIEADPTPNKSCVQWMLNVFCRYLRDNDKLSARRFVTEDLPQASVYLTLFEGNKRKKKFNELAKTSYILKNLKDPTDINQYKSLTHLFDAVDPFIIREPSEVESLLQRYVNSGQALIPVKDRRFTLYIPKTRDASVVFEKFSAWCTAVDGNGMFESYTRNNLKPNGKRSDIYIIIDNKFFTGESDDIYQIHFETDQIRDRRNNSVSIFEKVISESEGLGNFFYEELMEMARVCKTGLDNNKYLDYLIRFGFCESLFELMDENTPSIRIMKREIPRLSDLSRFKMLDQLIITDAKLVEIHPSIGKLTTLEMISVPNNSLNALPKELGSLKNLKFLNIKGNKIIDIPEELKYLDTKNGGSLGRIVTSEEDIGKDNYQKLKILLPNAVIN